MKLFLLPIRATGRVLTVLAVGRSTYFHLGWGEELVHDLAQVAAACAFTEGY